MSNVVELTPSVRHDVSKEKWDVLLERSLGATVFHSTEWAQALAATFRDVSIRYIVVEDQYGRYVAGMPLAVNRNLVFSMYRSMPFGTYGGPLVVEGLEKDACAFIGVSLQGMTRSVLPFSLSCVLYNTPMVVEKALHSAFPDARRRRISTHLIDLGEGFQKLWDFSFDKETRTCARKASRNGVEVEENTTVEGATVLHSLYSEQAGGWGLGRVYPERLVCEIVGHMREKARIWFAVLKGRPVCAVLAFYFRDTLMVWLSGQNEEGREARASHLIYSEILKHACDNGYSIFNFGGSGGLQGVRYFKESFGAREYFYSVFSSESALFRLARKLKGAATGAEG